jgi:hypothetical protein
MIVICEPQCREHGHEKLNSGFIYGLRLAYPQEKIIFYADITHIRVIKKILINDNIIINNIEYIPIKFRGSFSIIGMLTYYSLFKKMFSNVVATGGNKIFFLSFSPTILYIIKKLKQKRKFLKMKFTLVLHGDFENIADKRYRPIVPLLPNKPIIEKIRQTKLTDLPRKGVRFMINHIITPWQPIFTKLFPTKKILLWKHSVDFKYISLSPHIIVNAEEFIDVKKLNIYTVVMPYVFAEPTHLPNNKDVKFAIFGNGDSFMLHNVAVQLSQKELKKPYEIRIIGMDKRGTDGFPNITCPGSGEPLTRGEMEKYAQDIDIFLILYEKNRYRLSCSGSILESLSYMKPVLHFNNDCINTFNKQDNPIGICCNTIEEFVNIMEDIIENYQAYIHKFQIFRNNILKLRKEFAIENSVTIIKDSFTW